MNKEELLKTLANNISCFENVTLDDFRLLSSLETFELASVNDNVSRVTPLLKQIANYALIEDVIDDIDIVSLRDSFDSDDDTPIYDAIEVAKTCYEYIEILSEEECNHPSIINNSVLLNGTTLYEIIIEKIDCLIENTRGKFQNELIDLCHNIDDIILDISDDLFENIKLYLENGQITTKEQIITYLCIYAKNNLTMKSLMSKVTSNIILNNDIKISNIEDDYISLINNTEFCPGFSLKVNDVINSFTTLFQLIDSYQELGSEKLKEIIASLQEAYYLYNSYKYNYYKNTYKEQKLLEKCKKL